MSATPFINILIAEDNDVSRQMMSALLRAQGFNTLGAIDGSSAIKVVEEHPVDLALVDLNMAPKGGFEFVKYLMVNNMNIPVVLVTADDSSDLLMRASELGISRVLNKPIDPKRLIDTVQRILRQRGYNLNPIAVERVETRYSPEQLMEYAIDIAIKNIKVKRGGPFGAVVASEDGLILGEGASGMGSRVDPTAHAEVMAIRQAAEKLDREDLSDCVLYCSSEPTMMGLALIISVGIKKVFYGLSHEEIKAIRAKESDVRAEMSAPEKTKVSYQRLGHEKALQALQRWKYENP